MKLLPIEKTSWLNSPSPSIINKKNSPLLFLLPLTQTMMTTIVKELQF
jgi:hypothetical protein